MLIRIVVYDTQPLEAGQSQYTFFRDTDDNESSVTKKEENACLNFLFSHQGWRQLLQSELRLSPKFHAINFVTHPFYDPGRGEMDVIIFNDGTPHQAILIEAKRIKITYDEKQALTRNGLMKLFKGVEQITERAREFRFWQNYLMVIILSDGRQLTDLAQWNRSGINTILSDSIFSEVVQDLPNEIGVIVALILQSSGKSIDLQGAIGVGVWRFAQEQQQSDTTTNRVDRLINELLR